MRFTWVLLVALLLAVVVSGKTEYKKKCTKEAQRCKKVSVCLKAKSKCVEHRETQTKQCVKYKQVKKQVKVAVCKKYAHQVKDKCGNKPAGPKVCLKNGFVTKTVYEKKCLKKAVKKYCHKHKSVCIKKKTKKVCQKIFKKPEVTGPKSCKAGEFMKFEKHGKGSKRVCTKTVPKAVVYKTCAVYNDPHFTSFDKVNFDYHAEGDYNLVETSDGIFKVHGTFKHLDNQAWSGIVRTAILVNGKDVIEVYDRNIYLNKKKHPVTVNQVSLLPHGGSILLSANDVVIQGPNQAKVQLPFSTYGTHQIMNINIFIDQDDKTKKGLCTGNTEENKKQVAGLFHNPVIGKSAKNAYVVKKFHSATEQKNAEISCKAAGAKASDVKRCVFDLAQATNPKHKAMVLGVYKNKEAQKKIAKNAVLPLGHHLAANKGKKHAHKEHGHKHHGHKHHRN